MNEQQQQQQDGESEITERPRSRRRIDLAGSALFVVGVTSLVVAVWLVLARGLPVVVGLPAVVATVTGARHLTKIEAPRDLS